MGTLGSFPCGVAFSLLLSFCLTTAHHVDGGTGPSQAARHLRLLLASGAVQRVMPSTSGNVGLCCAWVVSEVMEKRLG